MEQHKHLTRIGFILEKEPSSSCCRKIQKLERANFNFSKLILSVKSSQPSITKLEPERTQQQEERKATDRFSLRNGTDLREILSGLWTFLHSSFSGGATAQQEERYCCVIPCIAFLSKASKCKLLTLSPPSPFPSFSANFSLIHKNVL